MPLVYLLQPNLFVLLVEICKSPPNIKLTQQSLLNSRHRNTLWPFLEIYVIYDSYNYMRSFKLVMQRTLLKQTILHCTRFRVCGKISKSHLVFSSLNCKHKYPDSTKHSWFYKKLYVETKKQKNSLIVWKSIFIVFHY